MRRCPTRKGCLCPCKALGSVCNDVCLKSLLQTSAQPPPPQERGGISPFLPQCVQFCLPRPLAVTPKDAPCSSHSSKDDSGFMRWGWEGDLKQRGTGSSCHHYGGRMYGFGRCREPAQSAKHPVTSQLQSGGTVTRPEDPPE